MRGRVGWGCSTLAGKRLTPVARKLRADPTEAQKRLWWHLRGRQLGVQFTREFGIGDAIVDFACRRLKLAIELDGGQADYYHTRGEAYRALGDRGRAIADFTKALAHDPRHVDSAASRGEAYEANGERAKAIEDYAKAISLPPQRNDQRSKQAQLAKRLAALQAAAAVAWAVWVCGLEVEGSIGLLVLVAVVNGLLGTMLGLLASAFATTEFQVVQFMPVIVAPQVLLGGIFLARDQMPDALQAISDWLPLSYSIDALGLVKTGGDTGEVLLDVLIVAAFALGALVLAALTLRRRTA